MALLGYNGDCEFSISKEKVFNVICQTVPTINGINIDNDYRFMGGIMVKAGVSLFLWVENIPIQLIKVAENKTIVLITSLPKTGIMFGGAFDTGKN